MFLFSKTQHVCEQRFLLKENESSGALLQAISEFSYRVSNQTIVDFRVLSLNTNK